MLVLVPGIRKIFDVPDGASLLASIIVLAVMILPSIIKVSVTALEAMPPACQSRAAASLLKRGAKRVRCVAIRHCKIFAAKRLPPHTWIFSFLMCEKYAASTSWSSSRPPR